MPTLIQTHLGRHIFPRSTSTVLEGGFWNLKNLKEEEEEEDDDDDDDDEDGEDSHDDNLSVSLQPAPKPSPFHSGQCPQKSAGPNGV